MPSPQERAQANLNRVMELTGARYDKERGCVLFKSRTGREFRVAADFIADGENLTCYYVWPVGGMLTAEKMAMAILSLYNNPENFDIWNCRKGAII